MNVLIRLVRSLAPFAALRVLVASLCCWLLASPFAPAAVASGKRVLVLHSYHQGFDWTDSVQNGLAQALRKTHPDAELFIEYLNTKRHSMDAVAPALRSLYRAAYARTPLDAIVVSDNNALDFVIKYRDELFAGIPVVFCGINNIESYPFVPGSGYTGVSEAADIRSTIHTALTLHPGTRNVAFIADATETGTINLAMVHKVADDFPGVAFTPLTRASAEQLQDELKTLREDTIVLNTGFYRDGKGRAFSARESMDFIVAASPRPVYTLWDFAMAPGAVGGKLISGRLQGEHAAERLARVLNGESPDTLPVIASPTEYVFDDAGLKRFNVPESLLPAGALILGKPDSFYTRYRNYLWSGGALIMLQIVIILMLLSNIVRRRHEEAARQQAVEALRDTNDLFSQFMQHSPIYVYIKEITATDSRVILASDNFHEMIGVRAADMRGRSMHELFPEEFAAKIIADDLRVFRSGRVLRLEESLHGRQYATIKFPIISKNRMLLAGYTIDITDRKRSEAEILATRNRLQATLDAIPDLLFEVGISGTVYNYHTGDGKHLAASADAFIGKRFSDFIPPEPAAVCQAALEEALATGWSIGKEYSLTFPDGEHWYEISAAPMPEQGDNDRHLIVLARDITERKRAEDKLRLAASVFSHAREGIMIADANGKIIDVNESFSRITGYSRAEALGRNPRMLNSGRQPEAYFTALWQALTEKGHWYGEIWNRRKDGVLFAAMQTISTIFDQRGRPTQYVSLFSDITRLKEHEKHLEHIAHYDVLTGLPNRVLLADRLHQAMAHATRSGRLLAVVYLDLDGFKAVNDHFGHETGDALLIALSNRVKLSLRQDDTLARLGGDEFIAVLHDLDRVEACLPMLDRLLEAAAHPIPIGDLTHQVSASLGVTFYPQGEDTSPDQLLRQADQSMYQAKLAGKNRYHIFDADQDRNVRGHHESLERIRRALTAGEFVLHYQPKVNMRTGSVIGAEALIRWQHPDKGLLAPAVFLPVVENHPLAVEIGEWVLETAARQIDDWRLTGLALPVSVNVGARQLLQSRFVDRLRELFAAHPGIQPGDLCIEVLETSALEDLSRTSQIIEDCQRLGATFALDDFGTGYSSLTYLKRLAVSQLKIDQSFVRDMLDDPDDLSILGGVLGLANAFRREVIAEGVETAAHGTMLLQLGCELAQGYGIARPMAASALPDWIARWTPHAVWSTMPRVDRADMPLLFAIVEHRAWINAVEAVLKGTRDSLPLVHHQCRFDDWLATEGAVLHGDHAPFAAIGPLHRRIHAFASDLCGRYASGQKSDALAGLDELLALRDQLIDGLEAIVRN